MSPIEAIVSWLEAQDLDLQLDIASFGSFLIFEDGDDPSLACESGSKLFENG